MLFSPTLLPLADCFTDLMKYFTYLNFARLDLETFASLALRAPHPYVPGPLRLLPLTSTSLSGHHVSACGSPSPARRLFELWFHRLPSSMLLFLVFVCISGVFRHFYWCFTILFCCLGYRLLPPLRSNMLVETFIIGFLSSSTDPFCFLVVSLQQQPPQWVAFTDWDSSLSHFAICHCLMRPL